MGNVFRLSDVSVIRNNKDILRNINWEISDGERWVVFGANGAGKTTLMQLLAARIQPTSGKVHIIGEDTAQTDLSQLRSLIGFASAVVENKISNNETVFNAVRSATYGITTSWRETYDAQDNERCQELLTLFDLDAVAQRAFSTLSSGEKKRVSIMRALMPNPEILLLDEPTAGLDLGGRERLLGSLTELANSVYAPVTVLVTHQIEDIPAGFTHGLLLQNGEMKVAGEITEVFTTQNLSALFNMNINVNSINGRFHAEAKI